MNNFLKIRNKINLEIQKVKTKTCFLFRKLEMTILYWEFKRADVPAAAHNWPSLWKAQFWNRRNFKKKSSVTSFEQDMGQVAGQLLHRRVSSLYCVAYAADSSTGCSSSHTQAQEMPLSKSHLSSARAEALWAVTATAPDSHKPRKTFCKAEIYRCIYLR